MTALDPLDTHTLETFRGNMQTLLENLSFAIFLEDVYRNTRVADLSLISFKELSNDLNFLGLSWVSSSSSP